MKHWRIHAHADSASGARYDDDWTPGLHATERAAVAAPSGTARSVQARGKKKRARPRKATKTEKKTEKKPKKNERGFEL